MLQINDKNEIRNANGTLYSGIAYQTPCGKVYTPEAFKAFTEINNWTEYTVREGKTVLGLSYTYGIAIL